MGRSTTITMALAVTTLATMTPAGAQEPELRIELEHDSERERSTEAQLRRLLEEYDISRWILTSEILIDERSIPHSHPVLTLHARHLGDDLHLLATFVHEQFHWFEVDRKAHTEAAMEELREVFPEVPVGDGQGARDTYSTYLHLIVCDMEFQAMTELVGEEQARAVLAGITHYRWIYRQVLEDPTVRRIITRHGFVVP